MIDNPKRFDLPKHWRKAFEGNYLGSWNLYNDVTKKHVVVTLKIDRMPRGVSYEEVTGQQGKKSACLVLRFEGKKLPFIVSVPNGRILAAQFGTEDPSAWAGKEFKLGTEHKKVKGEMTHVLRVMGTSARGEELKEMMVSGDETAPSVGESNEREPGDDA
jgi:hypothetical protein